VGVGKLFCSRGKILPNQEGAKEAEGSSEKKPDSTLLKKGTDFLRKDDHGLEDCGMEKNPILMGGGFCSKDEKRMAMTWWGGRGAPERERGGVIHPRGRVVRDDGRLSDGGHGSAAS